MTDTFIPRYISYFEQYSEFDYFLTTPDQPNPWQSDNTEFWDAERLT
jgi:regulator of G-protein signaling